MQVAEQGDPQVLADRPPTASLIAPSSRVRRVSRWRASFSLSSSYQFPLSSSVQPSFPSARRARLPLPFEVWGAGKRDSPRSRHGWAPGGCCAEASVSSLLVKFQIRDSFSRFANFAGQLANIRMVAACHEGLLAIALTVPVFAPTGRCSLAGSSWRKACPSIVLPAEWPWSAKLPGQPLPVSGNLAGIGSFCPIRRVQSHPSKQPPDPGDRPSQ